MVPTMTAAAIPIRKVFPEFFIATSNDTSVEGRGQPAGAYSVIWVTPGRPKLGRQVMEFKGVPGSNLRGGLGYPEWKSKEPRTRCPRLFACIAQLFSGVLLMRWC